MCMSQVRFGGGGACESSSTLKSNITAVDPDVYLCVPSQLLLAAVADSKPGGKNLIGFQSQVRIRGEKGCAGGGGGISARRSLF